MPSLFVLAFFAAGAGLAFEIRLFADSDSSFSYVGSSCSALRFSVTDRKVDLAHVIAQSGDRKKV